jgi:glycosyltransferase involved in cell wall biosynthesis
LKKITVITVAYNAKEQLEKTINNVLSLGSNYVELIIIDGGSTDGTVDLLEKYSTQLRYWISEPDHGIYDAMNKGWEVADIDSAILYLGAGDKLLSLPTNINQKSVTFGKVLIGTHRIFQSSVGMRLKLGNTLHHQALLIPKTLHPLPPFNLSFTTYADFDFNQRLYKTGIDFVNDSKFESYALPDGLSSKLDKAQMVKVSYKNYGVFFALLSWLYCTYCQLNQSLRHNRNE